MFSLSGELIKPSILLLPCSFLRNLQLTLKRSYALRDTTTRESRMLKKLMTGSNKKKKWHAFDQPHSKTLQEINFFAASNKIVVKPPDLPKIVTGEAPETVRVPSARVTRRVGVLNTVFLNHITSILAAGDLKGSEDVVGMGLEISDVHVMPDFKLVNVYWFTTGSPEKEAYLEEVLQTLGPRLRHALITLRVMGIVPPIQFVKDKKQAQLMQVEKLFEIADYGENFVPTKGANLFRPAPNACEISDELRTKIEEVEVGNTDSSQKEGMLDQLESESESLPASPPTASALSPEFMRQDIFGLRRDRIMEHITDLMLKRKQRQTQQSQSNEASSDSFSPEQIAIDVRNQNARTELFVKYLRLKQIENAKADKLESTEAYERKFYNSLRSERAVHEMEKYAAEAEHRLYKDGAKEIEIEDDYWSEPEMEDDDKDTRYR